MMISPKEDVGKEYRRRTSVLLDTSGSMDGTGKMRRRATLALRHRILRPQDRFNVISCGEERLMKRDVQRRTGSPTRRGLCERFGCGRTNIQSYLANTAI